MANKLAGDVQVLIPQEDGSTKAVVLRLAVNEMIALQDELGFGDDDSGFLAALNNIEGFKRLRTMIYHAMLTHEPQATIHDAGELMTQIGAAYGAARIGEIIQETLRWALPAPEPDSGKAAPPAETNPSPGAAS